MPPDPLPCSARRPPSPSTCHLVGKAWGITADLADRDQADRVCRQLTDEHADATLLVNAAGLFVPQPWNIDGGVTAGRN